MDQLAPPDSPSIHAAAQATLDAIPAACAIVDAGGRVCGANAIWIAQAASTKRAVVAQLGLDDQQYTEVLDGLQRVLARDADRFVIDGTRDERHDEITITPCALVSGGAMVQRIDTTHHFEVLREREAQLQLMEQIGSDAIYRLRYDSMSYDYLSPAIARLIGYEPEEVCRIGLKNLIVRVEGVITSTAPEQQRLSDVREAQVYYADYLVATKSGEHKWIGDRSFPWRDRSGLLIGSVGVLTDLTERRQAEAALRDRIAQDELVRAQAQVLAELSTPLFPISDRVVVMPLIGTLDTHRAQQMIEVLLEGIESHQAEHVLLDITGVAAIDTQIANVLIQAAQAARLLGAQVALTGIRPEVAQTIIGLGVDFQSLATFPTLQAGVAHALRR